MGIAIAGHAGDVSTAVVAGCALPRRFEAASSPRDLASVDRNRGANGTIGSTGTMAGRTQRRRSLMRRWLVLAVGMCGVSVAGVNEGCAVHDPLFCDASHPCTDPARPVCDLNGQFDESDHIKNTCISTPANCPVEVCGCMPGELITCEQTAAVRCGSDGMSSVSEPCALGCDSSIGGCKCTQGDSKCEGGAVEVCEPSGAFSAPSECALGCAADGKRCVDISASNGLNAALDAPGTRSDFTLGAGASFDTASGTVLDSNGSAVLIPSVLVSQPAGGPSIRAFLARSITLHGASVTGVNAFAIVADDTIEIDGTLDLRPSAGSPGPGSSTASQCKGADVLLAGSGQSRYSGGGGGAGHATSGAGGGNWGGTTALGGAAGGAYGVVETTPLVGGCAGGSVNSETTPKAIGGLGGGAAQLVARRTIRVVRSGVINAGGGGGGGDYSGGGGGAGGAVLLEAPTVVVDGSGSGVFVNGGAASCGGTPGASGLSSTAAAQATCDATGGGAGGTGVLAPTRGSDICPTPSACSFQGIGHGGGGAAGLLRVNTATGSFAATGGATTSAKSSVGTIGTR
ncbi:MAG: hypothetical protein K8W52_03775 [Deltaproteobacteria bacterium]|nr:hypothetical protein [Deltaproteobacteria bacterium]